MASFEALIQFLPLRFGHRQGFLVSYDTVPYLVDEQRVLGHAEAS